MSKFFLGLALGAILGTIDGSDRLVHARSPIVIGFAACEVRRIDGINRLRKTRAVDQHARLLISQEPLATGP